MRGSVGQERTLKRFDGKATPLLGMSSDCLFYITLKPNIIQRKIPTFIKLSDVDLDATLAKAEIKI